ncbi:PKD domain-containing protein [Sulfidibacter corallicola]|uniref:PKD domain-containing protein n=1 Tax=Sulfidibacter corallicola TaxID=2818388 RepID=A0A8A4TLC5_SULCO|nr:PKD domain-containing protein [Sulfidibacter corallicola]QTD49922.1 PKD domain-containing protein [Sulfidibacter corallicola]
MLFLFVSLPAATWATDWHTLMSDPDVTFEEVKQHFESYWAKRPVEGKKPGYKQFQRWAHLVESRLDDQGRFNPTPELWAAWAEYRARQHANGLFKADDFQGNWQAMGPFGGPNGKDVGRINAVVADPNDADTLFVCTPAGGIWKSVDGGLHWEPKTADLPTFGSNGLVIDPRDGNVIHAVTGDPNSRHTTSVGLLRSTDGGETWTRREFLNMTMMYEIVTNPANPDIMYFTSNLGVYKTTDGGLDWQRVYTVGRDYSALRDIALKPGSPDTIYGVTTNALIMRSTDGGASWSQTADLQANRSHLAVTPADPNLVYVLASDGANFKGFYRSNDGGDSFELVADKPNVLGRWSSGTDTNGQAWYDMAITVSPTDPNTVFVGGINLWKTEDGGATWKYQAGYSGSSNYIHADVHYLGYHHGVLYVGCDGGIYRGTAAGEDFQHLNDTLNIMQFYRLGISQVRPGHILGGSQDNGTSIIDHGTWQFLAGGDGMECAVDPAIDTTVYYSQQNGVLYRRDLATGMSRGITPRSESGSSLKGGWVTPFVLDASQPGTMYSGYNGVYKSTDRGDNWTKISDFSTGNLGYISVSPRDNKLIYAGMVNADRFHKTTDGGTTWQEVTVPEEGSLRFAVQNLMADALTRDKLWIAVKPSDKNADKRVLYSVDGGANWVNFSEGLPKVKVNCLVQDVGGPDRIYVGTDLGVYYREPGMSQWLAYNQGLPPVIVNELEIQYPTKKLRAASFSRGMWESDLYSAAFEAPIVLFEETNEFLCEGRSFQFNDRSTGQPTRRDWRFPGGSPATSNDANPQVTYTQPGVYDVTLTVTNQYGNDSVTETGYVVVNGRVDSFPWRNDFNALPEGTLGSLVDGWINMGQDKADWQSATAGVLDMNGNDTGPATDHGGDGTYLYLPNAPISGGTHAELVSPCLDLSGMDHPRLKFWYYLKGAVTSKIEVDVWADGQWHTDVVPPATGRYDAAWNLHLVPLTQFKDKSIRLRFRGSARISGGNRVALDDVEIVDDNSSYLPEITSVDVPQNVGVDRYFDVSATAVDPNGLSLSYLWIFPGNYRTTDANSRHYVSEAGSHEITLQVSNSVGAMVERKFVVQASGQPNRIPEILDVTWEPRVPKRGEEVTFTVEVNDPDGDEIEAFWRFGFGIGRSIPGTTVKFMFGASGRQHASVNINDGRPEGMAHRSVEVTVLEPDGSEPIWPNDSREGLSLAAGETKLYKFNPNPDLDHLSIFTEGGSGDVDLYIKTDAIPTTSDYDFRSAGPDNGESIRLDDATGNTYYLLLHSPQGSDGFTLRTEAAFFQNIWPGQTRFNNTAKQGEYLYYRLNTNDYSQITILTEKGEGDLDLYVKRDAKPTKDDYDFVSGGATGSESITIDDSAGKVYFIGLYAYEAFNDITLKVEGVRSENQMPVINTFTVPAGAKVGESVRFSALASDPDNDRLSFTWTIDGSTLNGSEVAHTFDSEGSYSVSLAVEDGRGGRATRQGTIVVSVDSNRDPIVNSVVVPRRGVAGEAVTLTVNASDPDGDDLTIAWDLGDGNTAEGASVDHTYANAGTYDMTITVTDGKGGRVDERASILIDPAPNRDPVIERLNVPAEAKVEQAVTLAVTASDPDGDTLTVTWELGDGQTTEGATATHTYTAAGTYQVRVTVSDPQGGSAQSTASIRVIEDQGVPELDADTTLFGLTEVKGGQLFLKVTVPANHNFVRFAVLGGTGDCDLYVKEGELPTTSDYGYRSWNPGNREVIDINGRQGRTYFVLLNAYEAFDGLMFAVNTDGVYTVDQSGAVDDLWGNRNTGRYFRIEVPAHVATLTIETSGGSGDCDLYLKEGSQPSPSDYQYHSYAQGNSERITVNGAGGKVFYLMKHAYLAYTGLSLRITME